jgi:hypothetical protein
MTGVALRKRQACELDVIGIIGQRPVRLQAMTFGTSHRLVLSGKSEFGGRMVESTDRYPRYLIVTIGAVLIQLSAMLVAMAPHTGRRKPEVGPARVKLLLGSDFQVTYELRTVAATAVERSVLSLKFVAGESMVEGALAVFPIDQGEVSSLMLDVTLLTGLVLRPAVKSSRS